MTNILYYKNMRLTNFLAVHVDKKMDRKRDEKARSPTKLPTTSLSGICVLLCDNVYIINIVVIYTLMCLRCCVR